MGTDAGASPATDRELCTEVMVLRQPSRSGRCRVPSRRICSCGAEAVAGALQAASASRASSAAAPRLVKPLHTTSILTALELPLFLWVAPGPFSCTPVYLALISRARRIAQK